ncbi:MAG TPA: EAL domain-containing protein [Oligoflexus sp.]|uniref:EAL domain-containing protein n=1 Tax=Oligoflexus sp. TaxID=1971216 RepID=UPI002D7F1465|nr:EAL domain-containing protein [Oligoflexus sp.]HET9238492.1 EAL domain-containing protein [Oligoflexus sp.]
MILIATKHTDLAKKLNADLAQRGVKAKSIQLSDPNFLRECYHPEVTAVIADDEAPGIPREANLDIFNALGRRVSVLVIRDKRFEEESQVRETDNFTDHVTILTKDQYDEILSTASFFSGSPTEGLKARSPVIPFYNPQIPITMLKNFGGLGILTLDASGFNKISVDYGIDVYNKMKRVLHDVLFNLWGVQGCIRESDVLCRRSATSNSYLIFMNRSRETGGLPYPGALEKVADRLTNAINNAMWQELFAPRSQRRIPDCVQSIPLLGVGFFGVLNNPCIDVHEILDNGLEASKQMAQAQLKRGRERQRELMQTLIQSDDLLTAHYQAVFYLQNIDQETVKKAAEQKSIAPLKQHIFGFESLIRVNQDAVASHNSFDSGIDSKYLRPDVLFSLAKYTNVALELDQACMKQAAKQATLLPGTLMVNILPRNLYYIDRLKLHFDGVPHCMFEVSESEAINNLDLMLKSRDHLERHNMGIAADDFGKGYSSLERIIKIRPDVIKFDRGMIQEIDKDPVKQAYVRGLVTAAKILNTTILAEGVETWEEAAVLKEMGIELIQGFLLHRPMAAKIIKDQLGIKETEKAEDAKVVRRGDNVA